MPTFFPAQRFQTQESELSTLSNNLQQQAANKTTTTTTTSSSTLAKSTTTTTATAASTNPQSSPSSLAAQTAQRHSKPSDLIFYGNLFCPFAQRIWIALEVKEIPYQYVEIEGQLVLPPEALEVNPQKRLPCIRHGNWGAWESGIIMEYVCASLDFDSRNILYGSGANESADAQFEDLSMGHPLLPLGDPQLRAHCRMWADHVSHIQTTGPPHQ